ncbi:MAG: hypothetical protein V3U79_00555 [Dehalococcoidia bacterium]
MSRDTYQTIAGLTDKFGIPRRWLQDLLHVNGVEVVGTSIAALAIALNWSKAEAEEFAKVAGSLGTSAIANANPPLGVLTLVTLAGSSGSEVTAW